MANWKELGIKWSGLIETLSGNFLGGTEENPVKTVMTGIPPEIRTHLLPDTSLERYHFSHPAR
jgi:hypothetical protein